MAFVLLDLIRNKIAARNTAMEMNRACRTGDSEALQNQLEKNGNPNAADSEGITAMMVAAGRGHLDCVKMLVEAGADIHRKDGRKGLTALKFAVGAGQLDVASYLLEKGADVNETDRLGRTGLMFAAAQGSIPIVKLFLEYGADVNLRDAYRNSALMNAEDMHHMEVAELLLEAGAEKTERFYLGDDDSKDSDSTT